MCSRLAIPYTYGDSNWKDKLTAYNGTAITYDAIGNPLNDGAWTFTWAAGRQLKKMVREDRTLDFKYDHNGMRIQKVLQHDWYPETTNYTYHGKLLTHMTVDYHDWDEAAQQDKLHFFYDAQSRPVKISYNGVIYTYVHNLQGDIVGILDSTGALVVEYKYDAWGKLLSTTGSLADTLGRRNPFRYRGYIYDEESELYYLRSRYYNPAISRMLIADNNVLHKDNIFGSNAYAYGYNNPIMYSDADGLLGKWLRGLVVAAVTTVAVVAVTVVAAPVVAAVATGAIIGAGANMLTQTVIEDKDFDEIDYADVAISGISGAACVAIPGSSVGDMAARAVVSSLVESGGSYLLKGEQPQLGKIFDDILWGAFGEIAFGFVGKHLGHYLDDHLLGGNRMQPRHYKASIQRITGQTVSRTGTKRAVKNLRVIRRVARKVIDTLYDAINAICSEVIGNAREEAS